MQTDIQRYRQTDRQTGRQRFRQTDRHGMYDAYERWTQNCVEKADKNRFQYSPVLQYADSRHVLMK
jgi:phage I-like protein